MTKLNQIVAIENGVKSKAKSAQTVVYQKVAKSPLLSGISRTYVPKDDDGDKLPPESTLVQITVDEVLDEQAENLTRLFDVTLTKDKANTQASADVVVDGNVIVKDAPITYLLFLEKQLTDIRTFVAALPVLDPAERWTKDVGNGVYVTDAVQTVKTKKIPRNHILAEATDKHPAQVQLFHEDVVVGTWTTIKSSGNLPATRVAELTQRVDSLINAVKFAREEANSIEVTDAHAGKAVFDYLFA